MTFTTLSFLAHLTYLGDALIYYIIFSVKILHLKESLIDQCLPLLLDLLDRNRKSKSEGLQFWILPNGILPLVSIPQHLGMPQDSIILQDIHSLIEVKFLISIFRYSCSNNLRYLSTIFFF